MGEHAEGDAGDREGESDLEPFQDVELPDPDEFTGDVGDEDDEGIDQPEYDPDPVFGDGPDTDEEMPLTEHIEEMINRLAIVMAIAAIAGVLTFPFGEEAIRFLWQSALPMDMNWQGPPGSNSARPHLYSPPELLIAQIKFASLVGFIVALPVFVYQTYRFMRPGLFPHERRYYLAAVPTSLILAFVGLTFAHFIVVPAVFSYFYRYSEGVTQIAFALGKTFNLILILMGYLALVFQIPLFIMLAIMMGLVTRRWLAERRLLFWGSFLGISFLFSPDPTGMSPLIIAVTMIVLFEGTLLLAKWTKRGKEAVSG